MSPTILGFGMLVPGKLDRGEAELQASLATAINKNHVLPLHRFSLYLSFPPTLQPSLLESMSSKPANNPRNLEVEVAKGMHSDLVSEFLPALDTRNLFASPAHAFQEHGAEERAEKGL